MLAGAASALAAAALGCTWYSMPQYASAPLSAGIVLGWLWHLRRILHWHPAAVHALEIGADGAVRCRTGSGLWTEWNLQGDSYVSAWLIVLRLGDGSGRRSSTLVLLPDSAQRDDLRRLRARLCWGSARS